MKTKKQKAFTLIELMITVAIIGILAAVAIPAYQDYVVRAQVSEAIILASSAKTPIVDYYATTGFLPADSEVAGFLSPTGKYVGEIVIENGKITSTFNATANAKISGKSIVLTPIPNYQNQNIAWNCSSDIIEKVYLPSICRE